MSQHICFTHAAQQPQLSVCEVRGHRSRMDSIMFALRLPSTLTLVLLKSTNNRFHLIVAVQLEHLNECT